MFTVLFTLDNLDIISFHLPTLESARRFTRSFRKLWNKAEIIYPQAIK